MSGIFFSGFPRVGSLGIEPTAGLYYDTPSGYLKLEQHLLNGRARRSARAVRTSDQARRARSDAPYRNSRHLLRWLAGIADPRDLRPISECAGMTALFHCETCLAVGKRRRVAAVQRSKGKNTARRFLAGLRTLNKFFAYFFFSKNEPSIERDSRERCWTFNWPRTECQPM